MKSRLMVAVSGVGLCVACASAGPLDKKRVDAGAKWLVHADVEAVMGSTTGRFIAEHRADLDMGPLEEFKKKTGLDGLKDIQDVTVYGLTDSPDEAVAMISGNEKLEAAVNALAAENKTVEKLELGGREVFKWIEEGTERFGSMKGVKGGGRVFVVSTQVGHLERALKVMDGSGESLSTVKDGLLSGSPRKGAMVYVVVNNLDSAAAHAPKVLRSAKQVVAEVGEDDEGFYGEMKLKTGSEDDVRNIADFGRGMLALGRMASTSDPELKDMAQIIDGVKLQTSGTELTASFRIGKELLNVALSELKSQHAREPKPAIEKTSGEDKR